MRLSRRREVPSTRVILRQRRRFSRNAADKGFVCGGRHRRRGGGGGRSDCRAKVRQRLAEPGNRARADCRRRAGFATAGFGFNSAEPYGSGAADAGVTSFDIAGDDTDLEREK